MKYSQRDLKAIDMFALLIIGIGILFFAIGGMRYMGNPKIKASAIYNEKGLKVEMVGKPIRDEELVETVNWPAIRTGLFGTVFLLLGTTMNLCLSRVMRNGGIDVEQDLTSDRSVP
jgi:hypothetical protein